MSELIENIEYDEDISQNSIILPRSRGHLKYKIPFHYEFLILTLAATLSLIALGGKVTGRTFECQMFDKPLFAMTDCCIVS